MKRHALLSAAAAPLVVLVMALAVVVTVEPRVEYLWSSYRNTLLELGALLFVALLTGVIAGYVGLRRLVLRPLNRLTRAAESRDRSMLREIAADPGSTEFGTLAGGFLGMIGQIDEKSRTLQRQTQELELAVAHRTRELKHALRRLNSARDLAVRQEKLASIGQLSAGIAHEIDNPVGLAHSSLSTLAEYNESVLQSLDEVDRITWHLERGEIKEARDLGYQIRKRQELLGFEQIREESRDIITSSLEGMRRIALIAKRLHRFSRREDAAPYGADIESAVREALQLLNNELEHRYDVVIDLDKSCSEVVGSEGQLAQIFVNLLMNAMQAMPEGGTIRIEQDCNSGHVVTTVTDNGSGIPEELLGRIFEPFFTTKPAGHGTGLGLSIVRDMVESLGGMVKAESTEGEGTTVQVTLPVLTEERG